MIRNLFTPGQEGFVVKHQVRSSLELLKIPFVFTQDELLDTGSFIRKAKERGHILSLETLQALHVHGLLVPIFRVSDTAVEGRRVDVGDVLLEQNPRGWVMHAALEGRLRDPREEGYSSAWPYMRPEGVGLATWWNGFVYSSWQLIGLNEALARYRFVRRRNVWPVHHPGMGFHSMVLALVALSPRNLGGVLGRINLPGGIDERSLWKFRSEFPMIDLLGVSGFNPVGLRGHAETLLARAHSRDPLAKWLPLVRHTSYSGWSKLKGDPLDCMWKRVAAEVLLRAHDELAEGGLIEPLPDLTGEGWWTPLRDRLNPRHEEAETLERALGDFGLSPHPKVIVLVEGETELIHIPRLLAQLGLADPQQVRVQRAKGSKVSPQLIARYGVTPRVGRRVGDIWLLDATPTALVIAMDAENKWATPEKCETGRQALLAAIQEEARSQGAEIPNDYLDFLVTVHVWGDDKYELANFTDDELIPAIAQVANRGPEAESPAWQAEMRKLLEEARVAHDDIKVPIGRMRIRLDKVAMAEALWSPLQSKLEKEFSEPGSVTPVIELVRSVFDIYQRISGIRAMKVPESVVGSTQPDEKGLAR
ncbi:hypothetical protein ACFYRL_16015 [Streptomyces goshikiensis]|uniref:hypothetical protein n=1 Tax=Streptomyces goshikiensis TaxID=1942 RepID=UPI0036D03FCE